MESLSIINLFVFPAAVLQIKMKPENAFPSGVEEERELQGM